MSAQPSPAALAALYQPSAESLRLGLPDMAEGIHSQIYQLFSCPCPDAADRLAANLAGASRAVLRFREALEREGRGNER